jgi:GMP synthase-like glutamine amidotransferase
MNVHVLQHVPFEGLGSIEPWLAERGAHIRYTRFFERDRLPNLATVDLLIIMGGPMSANDEAQLPWLMSEKQTIGEAIAKDIPTLGVCLGAQLIASALGARVYPNRVKEIGWFPIQGVHESEKAFRFPLECTVFHWHGETFDLPAGAVRLARSAGCVNQAFQLKENVIGLQFHLEMTAEGARAIVKECRNELVPGACIWTAADILDMPAMRYQESHRLMSNVLAYMTDVRPNTPMRPPVVKGKKLR